MHNLHIHSAGAKTLILPKMPGCLWVCILLLVFPRKKKINLSKPKALYTIKNVLHLRCWTRFRQQQEEKVSPKEVLNTHKD